jgi:hypothetical protein
MRQQKCPFGTTSNATGARAVTDCKYFADETWFRDSNSTSNTCSTANKCFQLSINGGGTVEISDTLKALLNK